jgi:predicted phosphohydrolase
LFIETAGARERVKLLVTADLHYDVRRSRQPTERLAERICRHSADALVLAGDTASRDLRILEDCLRLFDGFRGTKLIVAGNHDLWVPPGGDSLRRMDEELPAVCQRHGFHLLESGPAIVKDVALVGSVGWYDYSLRDPSLDIPVRFYEAKAGPGAAAQREEFRHLLDGHNDVPPEMMRVDTVWMDGLRVRMPISDAEFTDRLVRRLRDHLEQVNDGVRTVAAVIHHLPFVELVRRQGLLNWQFANAFMGSERFGQLLLEYPKVRHAFCGHSHLRCRVTCGHVQCVNVGCTYVHKRFEEWEI